MEQSTLHAGAAQIDVTPPLGTIINGDHMMHYARHIHDPLYAKALVLQSGETTVAIMVVDICAMEKDFLDEVKEDIQQQTRIPTENILISSTHTHAAGSVSSLLLSPADLPYRKKLYGLLVQAVVNASSNLQPARLGFGSVDAPEYLLCRRYKMKDEYAPLNPVTGGTDQVKTNPFGVEHLIEGPTTQPDPQVSYVAVQSTSGNWISLMANYSLHYVGDWQNGTITADYFGEFAHHLKDQLKADDAFVGIMSNGTSGEVSIWEFQNSSRFSKDYFAKSKLIGQAIAEKVVQSLTSIEWQYNPSLAVQYAAIPVGVRKPSAQELEAAKKIVGAADYEHPSIDDAGMKALYAREQVMLNEYPDTLSFPVQAIQIGNGVIGALGGEFFTETGLALKMNAGVSHYFTVSMANGYIGYVPPAHELEKGGYETWRCRTSCLEERAESMIREKLLQLVHAFKQNTPAS